MASTQFVRSRLLYDYSESSLGGKLRDALEIGDVLITSNPTEVLRPIVAFQNKYPEFPPASRKFTHVALYVGKLRFVHSMPYLGGVKMLAGGVEEITIDKLLPEGTSFVVLRFPGLTPAIQSELVDGARGHIGVPYDYTSIVRCIASYSLGIKRTKIGKTMDRAEQAKVLVPADPPSPVDIARALVCSDFVYSVYDELFQHNNPCNFKGGDPAPIKLPCAFYANPNFKEVDLDLPDASPRLVDKSSAAERRVAPSETTEKHVPKRVKKSAAVAAPPVTKPLSNE
jgi:hypothetical protein